jgi:predicted transcriptional regulator of viral defense system
MEVSSHRARRLLRYLADRGWLVRVARGTYATVPLSAREAGDWPVDPWVVAMRRFAPCYVSGWSALAYHGLTEQIFRSAVVMTAKTIRRREDNSQSTPFVLRHRDHSKLFGLMVVWRDGNPVRMSDRERTIIDVLDEPALAGGMTHAAEALMAYFDENETDEDRLISYGDRLANRAVFKRLGYIVEALQLADDHLLQACEARRSAGFTRLDPSVDRDGERNARWGLKINVRVDYLRSR